MCLQPPPSFPLLAVQKVGKACYLTRVSDVRIERMVESVELCVGAQAKKRCQVTYYTYLRSGGQLSYTHVERVVG